MYRLKGELTLQQSKASLKPVQGKSRTSAKPVKAALNQSAGTDPLPLPPHSQSEAEVCFHKALDIARHQQAKSLELRAAMSLHWLWQAQGKEDQAQQLLASVYQWFTEGLETADLQDAKALLG